MPSTRDPVVVVQPGPGRLPANTVPANALIFPPGGGSGAALTAHITDPVDAHMASAIGQTGYAAANATWVEAVAGVGGTQNALTKLFDSANARPTWVLDANPANKGDFVGPNALINAVAAAGASGNPNIFLRPGTYLWDDAVLINAFTIIGGRRDTTIIQNLGGDLRIGAQATFKNLLIRLSGDLNVFGGLGFGLNRFESVTFDVTGNISVLSALNTFEHVSGLDGYMDIQASGPGTTLRDFVNITVGIAAGSVNNKIEDGILTSVRNAANPVVDVLGDSNTVSNIYVGGLLSHDAPIVRVGGVNNSVDTLDLTDTTPGAQFRVVQFDGAQTGTVRGVNVHACPDFGVASASLFEFTNSSINCTLDTVRLDDLGSGTPIAFPLCGFVSGVNESNSLSNWEVSNIFLGTFAFGGVDIIRISTLTAKNLRIDRINVSGVTGAAGGKPIYIDGATVDPSNTISIQNCNLVGYGNAADAGIFIADCGANIVIDGTYCSTVTTTSFGLRVSNTRSFAASDCVFTAGSGRAALSANSGARYTRCKFIGGSANPNAGTKLFAGYGSSSLLAPNNPTAPMVLKDCIMEYGISNTAPVTGVGGGEAVIFFGGVTSVAATNHGPTDIDGLSIAPGSSVVNQHRDGLVVVDILAQDPAAGPGSYKNISIDLKEITWVADGAGRGFTPFGPGAVAAVFQMWGDTDSGSVPIAGGVFNTTGALLENLSISNVKEGDAPLDDNRHMFSAQGVRIQGLAVDGPTSGVHGTSGFVEAIVRLRGCTASNIRIGYEVGIKLKTINPLEYLYLIESVVDTVDIRVGVAGSLCNYLCRMEGSTLTKALLQNDNSASTMTDVGLQISGFSQLANYVDDVEVFVNSTLSSTKCLEVLTITAGAHISNTRASSGGALGLAGQECLRIIDSQNVTVRDSTFLEAGGRAGTVQNSGATLERVTFIGDNGTPAAGTQLFTGWGGATGPLVLRDCVMEYGSSNCDAAAGSGAGEPVIFFGGILGTVTVGHGPIMVDGLRIRPGASVVNQHRDSLVLIDGKASVFGNGLSTYANVEIDLKEKTWSASGATRGTSGFGSDATVLGAVAGLDFPTIFKNLRIVNIKEDAISDARAFLEVTSGFTSFSDVVILGPESGTHGAGSFSVPSVRLVSPTVCSNLVIGGDSGWKLSGASATYLLLTQATGSRTDLTLDNVLIGAPNIATAPHSFVWADDGNVNLKGLLITPPALVAPINAVVYAATHTRMRNCELIGATAVPVLLLADAANDADDSDISSSLFVSLAASGSAVKLDNVDRVTIRDCQVVHNSTTEPAIHAFASQFTKITGNNIEGDVSSFEQAITLESCDWSIVGDNIIEGIGANSDITAAGTISGTIHVFSNSFYCIIRNNSISLSYQANGIAPLGWAAIANLGEFNTVQGNSCYNSLIDTGTCWIISHGVTDSLTNNMIVGDNNASSQAIGLVSYLDTRGVVVGNVLHNKDSILNCQLAAAGTLASNNVS